MHQYLDLVSRILKDGDIKSDRTGVGTKSIFGHQMRFDLSKGFPLVTIKQTFIKPIISELLWFLEGSTDERRLAEILYGDSRENLIGKKTIWTANADEQGKKLGYENTDTVKELGKIYSSQWRSWTGKDGKVFDQISDVVDMIKTNPDSRRLIVSAWNVGEIDSMSLPPCHTIFQFYVSNGKLSCQLYQRSVDTALGLPFNIASYALLTMMIAQITNLQVGEFIHTSGDAHIYANHFDSCKLLLDREPLVLPSMILNKSITSINDFTMNDFTLVDYKYHDKITMEMAI